MFIHKTSVVGNPTNVVFMHEMPEGALGVVVDGGNTHVEKGEVVRRTVVGYFTISGNTRTWDRNHTTWDIRVRILQPGEKVVIDIEAEEGR